MKAPEQVPECGAVRRVGEVAVRNQPLAFTPLAPGHPLPPCCATVPLTTRGNTVYCVESVL